VSSLRAAGSLALRHFGRCAPCVSFVSALLAAACRPPPAAFGIAYATLRRPLRGRATAVWLRPLRAIARHFVSARNSDCGCPPASRRGGAGFAPTGSFSKDKKIGFADRFAFFSLFRKNPAAPPIRIPKSPLMRAFYWRSTVILLDQLHLRIALKIKAQARNFAACFDYSQIDNPIVFLRQFFNRGVYNPAPNLPEVINAWRYFE